MPWQFRTVGLIMAVSACLTGCGYTGAVPQGGYDTAPITYERTEPRQPADATILKIPVFDNSVYPDEPAGLPEPRVWKRSMPIAFVGEVELFDDQTDVALIRIEMVPILADGEFGPLQRTEKWAPLVKGEERIRYRLDWRAPREPGRYHVAIKSIGPALDFENLDTFVEGDVQVK
jgi:hypothetical protein